MVRGSSIGARCPERGAGDARPCRRPAFLRLWRMRWCRLLVLVLLAGCTLIDQRSFETRRSAPDAAADTAAPVAPAAPPLAIADGAPGWPERLAAIARDAATRDPSCRFDLVAPVPLAGDAAQRAAFRARQAANLQQAAAALAAAGIAPGHIRLALRGDPGQPAPWVELQRR